jgi:hypothetical protein
MRRSGTPSKLSDSVNRRLNSYALAASAAGVSLLALAPPLESALAAVAGTLLMLESAEAKIVYSPTNRDLFCGTTQRDKFYLHLDHRKATFRFSCFEAGGTRSLAVRARSEKEVWTTSTSRGHPAAALSSGAVIQSAPNFQGGDRIGMVWQTVSLTTSGGPWKDVTNRYLGLKFYVKGKAHYGWARLSTARRINATLSGYAYETIPNKPIIAGEIKGPDVVTIQPGSLGQLARGVATVKTH